MRCPATQSDFAFPERVTPCCVFPVTGGGELHRHPEAWQGQQPRHDAHEEPPESVRHRAPADVVAAAERAPTGRCHPAACHQEGRLKTPNSLPLSLPLSQFSPSLSTIPLSTSPGLKATCQSAPTPRHPYERCFGMAVNKVHVYLALSESCCNLSPAPTGNFISSMSWIRWVSWRAGLCVR